MSSVPQRLQATADELIGAIKHRLAELSREKDIPSASLLGAIEVLKIEVSVDHAQHYRAIMERHLAADHGAPVANDAEGGN